MSASSADQGSLDSPTSAPESSVDRGADVNSACIPVDENESPLVALIELTRHRAEIDRAIALEVARARTRGGPWRERWDWRETSWATIGSALGVSGQAAQQRFGRS